MSLNGIGFRTFIWKSIKCLIYFSKSMQRVSSIDNSFPNIFGGVLTENSGFRQYFSNPVHKLQKVYHFKAAASYQLYLTMSAW